MTGNGTHILNFLNDWRLYNDLERPAVSCNDAPPFSPPSAEAVVDEYLDVYHNVSKFVFSVLTTEPDSLGCATPIWLVLPSSPLLTLHLPRTSPLVPLAKEHLVMVAPEKCGPSEAHEVCSVC